MVLKVKLLCLVKVLVIVMVKVDVGGLVKMLNGDRGSCENSCGCSG